MRSGCCERWHRGSLSGAGEETRSVAAACLLDGEQVRLSMVGLAREDLILMPISGPPRVAPRGRRLLEGWLQSGLEPGVCVGGVARLAQDPADLSHPLSHGA